MLRSRKYSFQPSPTGLTSNNPKVAVKLITPDVVSTANVEWVGPITLRRRAKPELEKERHRDISLYLSVQEVKNLSSRGRYFCEICLDRTLYARTTSKSLDSTVFWGENFDLNNLPEISILTINLYKQRDVLKEKRYRSKSQNQFIAFLTIPLASLSATDSQQSTQWFPMQSPQAVSKTGAAPARTFSTGSTSPTSPSVSAEAGGGKSREVVTSPLSVRFRKRSTPVSCFRSPESATFEQMAEQQSGEPVPNGKRGSRTSWVASLSIDSSSSSRQHNGLASESSQTSPKSPGSSASVFTFHNPAMPQIRLQIRYEITEVLPLSSYNELRQYIAGNYRSIVRCLEPNLSVKQKEALAGCLVYTFEKLPDLSVFQLLVDMMEDDLLKNNDPALIFRSNSVGSKAMECYMKLVGSDYLHRLLKPCIDQLMMSDDDFELDPSRLDASGESNGSAAIAQLGRNLSALLRSLDVLWQRIQASEDYFPRELRVTFNTLGRVTEKHCGLEAAGRLTSSFLFLRLICPAIHGPVLYGLATSVPESGRISRNLTLVAKVLQNLANLTLFGEKEQHMKPVNVFVESQLPSMHSFLHRITGSLNELGAGGEGQANDAPDHHRFIDAGYELARLSRLLAAYQGQLNDELTVLLQSVNDQTHSPNWPFTKGNPATDTTLKQASVALATKPTSAINGKDGKVDSIDKKKGANSSSASPSTWASNSVHQDQGKRPDLETSKHSSHRRDQISADERTPSPNERTSKTSPTLPGRGRTRVSLVDQCFSGPDPARDQANGCRGEASAGFDSRACQTAEEVGTAPVSSRRDLTCAEQSRGEAGNLRENKSFANVFEYNDYEEAGCYGEPRQCGGSSGQHQANQALKGAASENVLSHPKCSLGESLSLDQLAEKMQEMKLILQNKRKEARRSTADRVPAFCNREESLERMMEQVEQLRRGGQTSPSQGHSVEMVERAPSPTVVNAASSPRGVSPSSSSYSSSGYSDLPALRNAPSSSDAQTEDRRCTSSRRQQLTLEVTLPEPEYSAGNYVRCNSFRALPDRQPVSRVVTPTANIRDPMAKHGGLNLLDLSLASEGTGIPLGKLIVSGNTPYHRRRYTESKFIEN